MQKTHNIAIDLMTKYIEFLWNKSSRTQRSQRIPNKIPEKTENSDQNICNDPLSLISLIVSPVNVGRQPPN